MAAKAIQSKTTEVPSQIIEFFAAWYHADGEKATEGDADKVRQALKELPERDTIEYLRGTVENSLIRGCVGGKGSRVVTENEVANMRKQFNYESASVVERLLIDRIILCWLRLQKCELERATYDKGQHMISHIEFAERQLHLAHTRYMRAIEELAKIQFLMSRTSPVRLAAVRDAMKGGAPAKVMALKAG